MILPLPLQSIHNFKDKHMNFLNMEKKHQGYWTAERFLVQLEIVATIVESKYQCEKGYRLYYVFDHSSCHGIYADDALYASKMNLKPGGKQPIMYDTYWKGTLQCMVFPNGTPKGLKNIMMERGIKVRGLKLQCRRHATRNYIPSRFIDKQPKTSS